MPAVEIGKKQGGSVFPPWGVAGCRRKVLVRFVIAPIFNAIAITLPILPAELFFVSPSIIELPPSRGVVTRQALTNEVPNKRQQVAQSPHQKFIAVHEAGSAHRGF